MLEIDIEPYFRRLNEIDALMQIGTVKRAAGLVIESAGPTASLGECCEIVSGDRRIAAEIIGFRDQMTLSMPLGRMVGIQPGDRVISQGRFPRVPVGMSVLGRVIDPTGQPLDGLGPVKCEDFRGLTTEPVNPLERADIKKTLSSGVRAIDGCLTLGVGQRVGLFGGSGTGKSVLLAMMARYTSADVNVIALVGERGREVRTFVERDLGKEGLAKSVVVVATSEHSPLLRIRAAFAAMAIAEAFRDQGQNVLLMMDSLTRFAMAQREVGLAAGEPPSSKGYTPSVFGLLPSLVERAGLLERAGSITGIFTVLAEGDDMNDPVADTARSLLDGHIVLSRRLAERGHFPAIDVPMSLSRLMQDIVEPRHRDAAIQLRGLLAALAESEDLIQIGAYKAGSNSEVDKALARRDPIDRFLRQALEESNSLEQAVDALEGIVSSESHGAQETQEAD